MIEKLAYRTANALRNAAQLIWPEEEAPDLLRDIYLYDAHRIARVNRVNGQPMEHNGTARALARWAADVSGSRYAVLISGNDGRATVGLADPIDGGITECWARLDEVRPSGVVVEFTEMRLA